jgi:hypothetical protein
VEGSWLKRNPREGCGEVEICSATCWLLESLVFSFSFFFLFRFFFLFGKKKMKALVGLKTEAEFWKYLAVLQVGGEANLTEILPFGFLEL